MAKQDGIKNEMLQDYFREHLANLMRMYWEYNGNTNPLPPPPPQIKKIKTPLSFFFSKFFFYPFSKKTK